MLEALFRLCCLQAPSVATGQASSPGKPAPDASSCGEALDRAEPVPGQTGLTDDVEEASVSSSPASTSASASAALNSRLKVPFSELTFHQVIGKGSFKQVYRGKWNNTNVAVVSMRRGGLVTEARVLQRLSSHPNLVQFYRWSTDDKGNEYIIVELVPFGSLDKVLVSFGAALRNRSKLLMCEQVCHAMCELADEGVLHRDLAARNILVQSMEPVHVKVTDFGLARVDPNWGPDAQQQQQQQAQAPGPTMVPVRWSPPEVLKAAAWSEKSDVWSYGVTMWEIFSNGAEPYARKSEAQVAAAIIAGDLLPRPKVCPKQVYNLMLDCWRRDPMDRPTFAHIAGVFRSWREHMVARARAASAAAAAPEQSSASGPESVGGMTVGPAAGCAVPSAPGTHAPARQDAAPRTALRTLQAVYSGEQLPSPDAVVLKPHRPLLPAAGAGAGAVVTATASSSAHTSAESCDMPEADVDFPLTSPLSVHSPASAPAAAHPAQGQQARAALLEQQQQQLRPVRIQRCSAAGCHDGSPRARTCGCVPRECDAEMAIHAQARPGLMAHADGAQSSPGPRSRSRSRLNCSTPQAPPTGDGGDPAAAAATGGGAAACSPSFGTMRPPRLHGGCTPQPRWQIGLLADGGTDGSDYDMSAGGDGPDGLAMATSGSLRFDALMTGGLTGLDEDTPRPADARCSHHPHQRFAHSTGAVDTVCLSMEVETAIEPMISYSMMSTQLFRHHQQQSRDSTIAAGHGSGGAAPGSAGATSVGLHSSHFLAPRAPFQQPGAASFASGGNAFSANGHATLLPPTPAAAVCAAQQQQQQEQQQRGGEAPTSPRQAQALKGGGGAALGAQRLLLPLVPLAPGHAHHGIRRCGTSGPLGLSRPASAAATTVQQAQAQEQPHSGGRAVTGGGGGGPCAVATAAMTATQPVEPARGLSPREQPAPRSSGGGSGRGGGDGSPADLDLPHARAGMPARSAAAILDPQPGLEPAFLEPTSRGPRGLMPLASPHLGVASGGSSGAVAAALLPAAGLAAMSSTALPPALRHLQLATAAAAAATTTSHYTDISTLTS